MKNKPPVSAAAAVYAREACARTFEEDLEAHLLGGWVISTPEVFIMARPVHLHSPAALVLDPWHVFPRALWDCWHVWLAAGDIRQMPGLAPFFLPRVSFERDNRLISYKFESLRDKISTQRSPCLSDK